MLAFVQDPASLDKMHDIVVLGPSPWWPPAPGWYVLGGLLLFAAIVFAARALQRWKANRYRGAALKELFELRQSAGTVSKSGTVSGLNRILKRAALVAWPRADVSTLSGEAWIEFLNRSARGVQFTAGQSDALRDIAYSSRVSEGLATDQLNQLFDTAEQWIRRHRVEELKA